MATLAILPMSILRTTTRTGLEVTARLMAKTYRTGVRVSAAEYRTIRLTRHKTCPQWDYTIRPRTWGTDTE